MEAVTVVTRPGTLSPQARLTRAHLAIASRPAVREEAQRALEVACTALTQQLGAEVTARACLRDATLSPLSQLAQNAVFAVVELRHQANGLVEIDGALAHALLQRVAGSAQPVTLPTSFTRIEEAALGWLMLAVLSSLSSSAFSKRYGPKLVGLYAHRHEALGSLDSRRRHLAIDLSMQVDGHAGSVRLIVPSLTVQAAIEVEPVAPATNATASVLAARIEAVCLAGQTTLSPSQLNALGKGDVVLFGQLGFDSNGALHGPTRLRTKTFELFGQLATDLFTITRCHPLETPLPTPHDPTALVDLEIELTRVRIALHELGLVKAGTVVPLHVNAAQPVTLRIGDRAIARAELVDIEGEIGARILTLL